jgi:hypothetical protein
MPDPATDAGSSSSPPPGGYDLLGDAQKGMADASKSLADLTRGKIAKDDAIEKQTQGQMGEDRHIAREYFNREAASLDDVKPWNTKQEAAKYAYDPIEAFGSVGSLFGILASAFTKAPMQNGLNAASSAMNAIKAGKQDEYKNAFAAWKENNDLVIKRGEMMHRQMQDALELFSKDSQAGEAAMRNAALKFGDQKALVMLDHGMVPELVQYYGSLGTAMTQLTKANTELTEAKFKQKQFSDMGGGIDAFNLVYNGYKDPGADMVARAAFEDERKKTDDKPLDSEALMRVAEKVKTFSEKMSGLTGSERETFQKLYVENHMKRGEDGKPAMSEGEAMRDALERTSRAAHPNQNADQVFMGEYYAAHPEATPEEFSRAFGEFKAAQRPIPRGGAPTAAGAKVQEKSEIKDDIQKAHPEWTKGQVDLEADRQIKAANATPVTGNKKLEQEAHVHQYDLALKDIDEVTGIINKHAFSAGAAGYATRAGERLSNLVGSSATDRVQMERVINTLQATAPSLLLDRATGRPLSSEASHINKIIAGLGMGDTTANTLRAFREIKERYTNLRASAASRIGEGAATDAKPSGSWAPPVNERVQ